MKKATFCKMAKTFFDFISTLIHIKLNLKIFEQKL